MHTCSHVHKMCREQIQVLMLSAGYTEWSPHGCKLQYKKVLLFSRAATVMATIITIIIIIIDILLLSSFLAVLESVSLEKIIPESPQSSEAGDMSPCRSPSTPRHLRYRQPGGKNVCVCLCGLWLISRPQCRSQRPLQWAVLCPLTGHSAEPGKDHLTLEADIFSTAHNTKLKYSQTVA